MSYAICLRVTDKNFQVSCVRCREDLGTMNGDTLRRAILFAINKGGVMCPNCRETSCTRCGMALPETLERCLCTFCRWEDEARRQETVKAMNEESKVSNAQNGL